jgi:hypothetical protein
MFLGYFAAYLGESKIYRLPVMRARDRHGKPEVNAKAYVAIK